MPRHRLRMKVFDPPVSVEPAAHAGPPEGGLLPPPSLPVYKKSIFQAGLIYRQFFLPPFP
jgi:hypothetical protein